MSKTSKPKDNVTRALKADFDQAHREGIEAINKHDFDRVDRAVRRERTIIGKLKSRVARQRAKLAVRSK